MVSPIAAEETRSLGFPALAIATSDLRSPVSGRNGRGHQALPAQMALMVKAPCLFEFRLLQLSRLAAETFNHQWSANPVNVTQ